MKNFEPKQYKNSGIRYWKDCFNDLKPFDKIDLDELLTRYHNTLLSFDNYKPDKDWFFIPIKKQTDLEENYELLRLHEKFNSPNAVIEEGKNKRIAFSAYGKSPYFRKHYSKGGENGLVNSHQNWKDGLIRPGLNISDWNSITKRLIKGEFKNEFIYLEIPYEVVLNFLEINHTNHPMRIPKQFVNEVEKTKRGWNDDDSVNKLINEYDKKYPNWNFDFPIFGYTSFIKYGTLFPTFYFGHKIFKNGTHRMYNTCLSKSDVPVFINVPIKNLNKFNKLIIDENKFMIFTPKLFSKFQDEYSRLFICIDYNEKMIEYYLSDDDVYGVRYGRFQNKKYLGYSKF